MHLPNGYAARGAPRRRARAVGALPSIVAAALGVEADAPTGAAGGARHHLITPCARVPRLTEAHAEATVPMGAAALSASCVAPHLARAVGTLPAAIAEAAALDAGAVL